MRVSLLCVLLALTAACALGPLPAAAQESQQDLNANTAITEIRVYTADGTPAWSWPFSSGQMEILIYEWPWTASIVSIGVATKSTNDIATVVMEPGSNDRGSDPSILIVNPPLTWSGSSQPVSYSGNLTAKSFPLPSDGWGPFIFTVQQGASKFTINLQRSSVYLHLAVAAPLGSQLSAPRWDGQYFFQAPIGTRNTYLMWIDPLAQEFVFYSTFSRDVMNVTYWYGTQFGGSLIDRVPITLNATRAIDEVLTVMATPIGRSDIIFNLYTINFFRYATGWPPLTGSVSNVVVSNNTGGVMTSQFPLFFWPAVSVSNTYAIGFDTSSVTFELTFFKAGGSVRILLNEGSNINLLPDEVPYSWTSVEQTVNESNGKGSGTIELPLGAWFIYVAIHDESQVYEYYFQRPDAFLTNVTFDRVKYRSQYFNQYATTLNDLEVSSIYSNDTFTPIALNPAITSIRYYTNLDPTIRTGVIGAPNMFGLALNQPGTTITLTLLLGPPGSTYVRRMYSLNIQTSSGSACTYNCGNNGGNTGGNNGGTTGGNGNGNNGGGNGGIIGQVTGMRFETSAGGNLIPFTDGSSFDPTRSSYSLLVGWSDTTIQLLVNISGDGQTSGWINGGSNQYTSNSYFWGSLNYNSISSGVSTSISIPGGAQQLMFYLQSSQGSGSSFQIQVSIRRPNLRFAGVTFTSGNDQTIPTFETPFDPSSSNNNNKVTLPNSLTQLLMTVTYDPNNTYVYYNSTGDARMTQVQVGPNNIVGLISSLNENQLYVYVGGSNSPFVAAYTYQFRLQRPPVEVRQNGALLKLSQTNEMTLFAEIDWVSPTVTIELHLDAGQQATIAFNGGSRESFTETGVFTFQVPSLEAGPFVVAVTLIGQGQATLTLQRKDFAIALIDPATSLPLPGLTFNGDVQSYALTAPFNLSSLNVLCIVDASATIRARTIPNAQVGPFTITPRTITSLPWPTQKGVNITITFDFQLGAQAAVFSFLLIPTMPELVGCTFLDCTGGGSMALPTAFDPFRSVTTALTLPSNTSCLTFTPTATRAGLSAVINARTVNLVSGAAIQIGVTQINTTNSFTFQVNTPSTGRYTFLLYRQAPAVGLTSIQLIDAADKTALVLSPSFSSSVRVYTVNVSSTVSEVTFSVNYLTPDTVTARLAGGSNIAVAVGVSQTITLATTPGNLVITSAAVGTYTIQFVRIIAPPTLVYDTRSIAIATSTNTSISFGFADPRTRVYSVSVPYTTTGVLLTVTFLTAGTGASATTYQVATATPIAIVSGVASSIINLAYGATRLTITNPKDTAEPFQLTITRSEPPRFAETACNAAADLNALNAACTGTTITNATATYGSVCSSTCAGLFLSFYERCISPTSSYSLTQPLPGTTLYAACQVHRPVSFYYPTGTDCASLSTAATSACGVASLQSITGKETSCSSACSTAWSAFSRPCLPFVPSTNTLLPALTAFGSTCSTLNPLSLAGVAPTLNVNTQPTDQTAGRVTLTWNDQAFTTRGLRVDSWVVESSTNAAFTTPSNVAACALSSGASLTCVSAGWAPLQQVWFRLRGVNAASSSSNSGVVVATALGTPIPTPATVTCGVTALNTIAIQFTPPVTTAVNPAITGYTAYLFPDSTNLNAYRVSSIASVNPFAGTNGLPISGEFSVLTDSAIDIRNSLLTTARSTAWTNLTDSTKFLIYVQANSANIPGLVSAGIRCSTPAAPVQVTTPPALDQTRPVTITPAVIDTATRDAQLVLSATAIGFAGAIRSIVMGLTYKPYGTSESIVLTPIDLRQVSDVSAVNVATAFSLTYTVSAGSTPFTRPGVLELTTLTVTDLASRTLALDAAGLAQAGIRISIANNFIAYPTGQNCAERVAAVNAACGTTVASLAFGTGVCQSLSCANVYNSFYSQCLSTAVFPSTSETTVPTAATRLFDACKVYTPLSQYYPTAVAASCATSETSIKATCGLTDISSGYRTGLICSAQCAVSYISFSGTCFVGVPSTSAFLTSQQAFLASCVANQPTAPKSAPELTAAGAQGGHSINVRWAMPADATAQTGLSLTFTLEISSNDGASYQTAYSGALQSFVVSTVGVAAITPNTSYRLRITASNSVGPGPVSAATTVTTRGDAPSAPATVAKVANSETTSSFDISWGAGAAVAGVTVGSYKPCIVLVAGGPCTIVKSVSASTFTATFTNLQPGRQYSASVFAVSTAGDTSVAGALISVTTELATPATPPTPTVATVTANSITLRLPALADATNSVTQVQVTLTDGVTPVTIPSAMPLSATLLTFTNLRPATVYTFSWYAQSATKQSSSSVAGSATTNGVPPSIVAAPAFTTLMPTSFVLSWSAPLDNGGSTVSSYSIAIYSSADGFNSATRVTTTGRTYTATGLTSGASYSVTLVAINAYGPGASLTMPTITLASEPIAITNIIAAPGVRTDGAFGTGSVIIVKLSAPINTAALTNPTQPSGWFTFTSPASVCPFTAVIASDAMQVTLTFNAGGGVCGSPTIGLSTIQLNSAANFVTGSGAVISAASTSTSGALSGRWSAGLMIRVASDAATTIVQGTSVALNTLFTFNAAMNADTVTVTISSSLTGLTVAPAAAVAYSGLGALFPMAGATVAAADFINGRGGITVSVYVDSTLVDSALIAITVAKANHPIAMTAPTSLRMAPSSASITNRQAITGVTITDPDSSVNSAAACAVTITAIGSSARVNLQSLPASVSSLLQVSPSLATDTQSLTVRGPVTAVQTMLAAGSLTAAFGIQTGTSASQIIFYVDDLANGAELTTAPTLATNRATSAYATINVELDCALADAPKLLSAVVSDAQNSIDLTFDTPLLFLGSNCLQLLSDYSFLGAGAVCVPGGDGKSFTMRLASGNTLTKSQSITLRPNTISVCAASTTFSSGTVTLTPPQNPSIPTVTLRAPAAISPCDDLHVTATTTFDVLQTPLITWLVSSPTAGSVDVSLQSGLSLTVPSADLLPGATYTVSASFVNALGLVSSMASTAVLMRTAAAPALTVRGDAVRTVLRGVSGDSVTLAVDVTLPVCISPNNKASTFQWSVTLSDGSTPTGVTLPAATATSPRLVMPLASLADNTQYTFTFTVVSQSTGQTQGSTTVKLTVTSAPLVVSSPFAASRQIGSVDSLALQLVVVDPSATSETLTVAWTCQTVAGALCMSEGALLTLPNTPAVTIAAGALTPDTYRFTGVAHKGTREAAAIVSSVTVVPTAPPIVAVTCPTRNLDPTSAVSISASVTARASDSTLTYSWSTSSASGGLQAALASNTRNLALNAARSTVWTQGDIYSFTLTVTETATSGVPLSTVTTCTVRVNAPPSGGLFAVSPASGLPFTAYFTFSAPQWQSSSGALSYSFYRIHPLTGAEVPLSPPLADGSFRATMPGDLSATTNTIVTVGVIITDENGASTKTTTTVTILPITGGTARRRLLSESDGASSAAALAALTFLKDTLSTSIVDALNRGDTDALVNAISNIASTANVAAYTTVASAGTSGVTAATSLNDQLVSILSGYTDSITVSQLVGAIGQIGAAPSALSASSSASFGSLLVAAFSTIVAAATADTSGAGTAATSAASATALTERNIADVMQTIDRIITAAGFQGPDQSATTAAYMRSSPMRRLLATDAIVTLNNRASVLAAYSSLRALLSSQSVVSLVGDGSSWSSDVGSTIASATTAGVTRFDANDGVTINIATLNQTRVEIKPATSSTASLFDARFIVTAPNAVTWSTPAVAAETLLTGSPALTVEVTTIGGVLTSDAATLAIGDHTFTVQQPFDGDQCPTATCQPVCKLYDPASFQWVDADLITEFDSNTKLVRCTSAYQGTIALARRALTVTPGVDSSTAGTGSSTGAAGSGSGSATGTGNGSATSGSSTGVAPNLFVDSSSSGLDDWAIGIAIALPIGFVLLGLIGFGFWYYSSRAAAQRRTKDTNSKELEMTPVDTAIAMAGPPATYQNDTSIVKFHI